MAHGTIIQRTSSKISGGALTERDPSSILAMETTHHLRTALSMADEQEDEQAVKAARRATMTVRLVAVGSLLTLCLLTVLTLGEKLGLVPRTALSVQTHEWLLVSWCSTNILRCTRRGGGHAQETPSGPLGPLLV
jgi:hypothetical protein